MADLPQPSDDGAIRRKQSDSPIIWGGVLIALAIAMFLGVAFMWGVGATFWGPLSPSVFSTLFLILMGCIPTGVVGLILRVNRFTSVHASE